LNLFRMPGRPFKAGLVLSACLLVGSSSAVFAANPTTTVPSTDARIGSVPPAPKGFHAVLEQTAAAELRIAKAVSMLHTDGGVTTAEALVTRVKHLSPTAVNAWYVGYGSMARAQKVEAELQLVANDLADSTQSTTKANKANARMPAVSIPNATGNPGGGEFNPPQTTPPVCVDAPSPYIVEALQLATASLQEAVSLIPPGFTEGAIVAGEGVVTTFPDPAYYAADVAYFISELALQAVQFIVTLNANCETTADQTLVQQLYNNLSDSQQAIFSQTQTLLTNVAQLTALANSRTQTLLDKTAALKTYVAEQTTAILNDVSGITTLVNANDSTILSDLTTVEADNNAELTLMIQDNLLTNAQTNVASFELPVSAGGYLNASPVGVQSVVTQTFQAMKQAHMTISADATTALSAADQFLNADQYKLAYLYFKLAYQTVVQLSKSNPTLPFPFPTGG